MCGKGLEISESDTDFYLKKPSTESRRSIRSRSYRVNPIKRVELSYSTISCFLVLVHFDRHSQQTMSFAVSLMTGPVGLGLNPLRASSTPRRQAVNRRVRCASGPVRRVLSEELFF